MPAWIFKAIQYAIEDIFDISGIPKLQKSFSKELQYTVQEMKAPFPPTKSTLKGKSAQFLISSWSLLRLHFFLV